MQKNLMSLGLMSGTSGDGVDASLIRTDGINHFEGLLKINILNMIQTYIKIFTI